MYLTAKMFDKGMRFIKSPLSAIENCGLIKREFLFVEYIYWIYFNEEKFTKFSIKTGIETDRNSAMVYELDGWNIFKNSLFMVYEQFNNANEMYALKIHGIREITQFKDKDIEKEKTKEFIKSELDEYIKKHDRILLTLRDVI